MIQASGGTMDAYPTAIVSGLTICRASGRFRLGRVNAGVNY